MLLEPANAVTDLLLTLVAVALTWRTWRWGTRLRYWCAAFAAASTGAFLGTLYHGAIKANTTVGPTSWAVITLFVALTISFLLTGTVALLVGSSRARFWLWLRLGGLVAYGAAALTGHAGLQTLLLTESLTMAAVLVLWWRAWRRHYPGSAIVLLAVGASAVGGALRTIPLTVHAGWTFDSTAIYHLAQVPGLVLLYAGLAVARLAGTAGRDLPPASYPLRGYSATTPVAPRS